MKTRFQKYQRELTVLGILGGFLLIVALTVDYHRALDYLFSDESVYYMMAQSLAFDQDLEYSREDLLRVYKEGWNAGPLGVFLNKLDGKIYYSKAFIYSWALSPFMRIFGMNGFLVMNALIFLGLIVLGWLYLRQYNASWPSLLLSMVFFLVSASTIYLFWLTPEIFNMGCVASGLFLWLYRRDHLSSAASPEASRRSKLVAWGKWLLLSPQGRLYLAPIPIAMATVSKPPNILFFAPILAELLFFGSEEQPMPMKTGDSVKKIELFLPRIKLIAGLCLILTLVILMFYGLQYRYTGSFNPYGGDRRTFYHQFPLDGADRAWEKGIRLSTGDYWEKSWFFHPKTLVYNIYYYLFGRFTGMLPYFLCSFLALYYLLRRFMRWRRPCSREEKRIRRQRIFLLLTILGSIGAYIILMPINYHGGGGAFGNRYFINIYPAFLFLVTAISSLRPLLVSSFVSVIFLAQAFVNPFRSSYFPARHAFHGIHRLLPVELTLIDTLPNLINRHLMQTAVQKDGDFSHRIYFFDENIHKPGARVFWVKGGKRAEMAIRTFQGQEHIVIRVKNGLVPNVVELSSPEHSEVLNFTTPGEVQEVVWPVKEFLPYFTSSLHPLSVRSQRGAIPLFTPGSTSRDAAFLGCQVSFSFTPLDIGEAYLRKQAPEKAIEVLEALLVREPENIKARYALGHAYRQAASFENAIQTFEAMKEDLPNFRENFLAEVLKQDADVLPKNRHSSSYVQYEGLQEHLALTRLQYEAEALQHNTGEIVEDSAVPGAKAVSFVPGKHLPGFLVYGPYVTLPAGEYLVKFHMKVGKPGINPADKAGFAASLDVYRQRKKTIAAREISLVSDEQKRFGSYQDYALTFTTEKASLLEFRVNVSGRVPVSLNRITVSPMFPVRLYEALGESFFRHGNKEQAYHYLHQVTEQVEDVEYVPTAFEYLVDMQQWEYIGELLQHHDAFSAMKSGPLTSLLQIEVKGKELPDDLSHALRPIREYFSPEQQQLVNFQNLIMFRGLDLSSSPVAAGESFRIVYYWEALQAMDKDYTIFVHFVKQGSASVLLWKAKQFFGKPVSHIFQQDHAPFHGEYPTSRWKAGEIIREQFDVLVPAGIVAGNYEIRLGIYDLNSGKRLKSGGKTKVNIGELTIHAAVD
ncbi:MAG: hypothetical protein GY801_19500 [bacterium]|nr:hypothetical protein [bacterium]